MNSNDFWKNKKVLITGNTGFKGSWLSAWLHYLGADVYGYSLEPQTTPSIYNLINIENLVNTKIGDIRNLELISSYLNLIRPEIIFHLAAQPLVKASYANPIETYETNVMGTANLLESVRCMKNQSVRSIVIVTTDKCYENKEWCWSYREEEPLGGYDPYSSSKAATELIVSSYRSSFFNPSKYLEHQVGLASARAGNVIGGGDWSIDRLVPDIIKALTNKNIIRIRNPHSIRPWQHVLEPLSGYILLAQKLYETGNIYSEAFNFGPIENDSRKVSWIVNEICQLWRDGGSWLTETEHQKFHEAFTLKLDISKAKYKLDWEPKWDLKNALKHTVKWYEAYLNNENMLKLTMQQIKEYEQIAK